VTLLGSSTHGGAFFSESTAVRAPSFAPPPIHFAYALVAAKLSPKSEMDLPQISQIFSRHCPAIDLPFFCLQTKIPEIGVIGGYLLIRVCRYKLGGYPAPYWALGPGVQPQITRISRIFSKSLPCN
jgi:hypothetical protein